MFYVVVCLCWAGSAFAAPASTDVVPLEKQQPTVIPIVSQSEELEPNGTYKFSYETGNGIKREETSYDKKLPKAQGRSADSNEGGEGDDSDEIHVQQGSYSYTAPDGSLISVRYIADENGFQPIGDHIPRGPGPVQNSGSSERGSKALKARDNAEAGSAPASSAKPAEKPESPPEAAPEQQEGKSTEGASEAASTTAASGNEVTTKVSDASAEASTTEAAITSEVPNEATSTETPKSSEALTTTEVSAESASTGAPKSSEETTEAASTVAPKSTDASEAASTVASDQPAPSTPESSTTEASTTVATA